MAVVQKFDVEIPSLVEGEGGMVTMSREQAEQLHAELGEALGFGQPTAAPFDPQLLQAFIAAAQPGEEFEMPYDEDGEEIDLGPSGVPVGPGRTLSVEEFAKQQERKLAAEQVAARHGQDVRGGVNRGSGIGSGQR